ncbi:MULTISPECIES: hypothetical protein [Cryobacterium]|nr:MULTISPECIES: hypothetical protein [Cryobacterium]
MNIASLTGLDLADLSNLSKADAWEQVANAQYSKRGGKLGAP